MQTFPSSLKECGQTGSKQLLHTEIGTRRSPAGCNFRRKPGIPENHLERFYKHPHKACEKMDAG